MSSEEFRLLATRVGVLKRRFFPRIKPTANYTAAEQDNMRALRMLVHAEIEHYLEVVCKKLALDLKNEAEGLRGSISIKRLSIAAANLATSAANSNNGVKDSDIKSMFKPLGIDEADFEKISPDFLDRMKQFGIRRGDVAHKSAHGVSYVITRQGEEKTINEIISLLKVLDKELIRRRLMGFLG